MSPEFPPTPDTGSDYAAWVDGEEETTTVTGPTPSAALAVLVERLVDQESSAANQQEEVEGRDQR